MTRIRHPILKGRRKNRRRQGEQNENDATVADSGIMGLDLDKGEFGESVILITQSDPLDKK